MCFIETFDFVWYFYIIIYFFLVKYKLTIFKNITLSRANRLIANSDIRSVILENKTTDVKSLKYYYFVLIQEF